MQKPLCFNNPDRSPAGPRAALAEYPPSLYTAAMNTPPVLRWAAAVLVSLVLAGLLALLFHSTDLALGLWDRLQQAPLGFVLVYAALILLITLASGVLMWRVLRPRGRGAVQRPLAPPDESELRARIDAAEQAGVDAGAARAELATLRERQHGGAIYIALLGEASTGKSSLVKALLPDAQVEIAARGGTTGAITRYHWPSPDSRDIVLCDMPGLNTPRGQLDPLCRAEAQRAHLVIYLTQGDLTRRQWQELVALTDLGKPVVLALNKIDQLASGDRDKLQERLAARVKPLGRVSVVPISAGGRREVVKRHADGHSESVLQTVPARIEALSAAIDTELHT
ncbi:MAG: GTPase, partial [Gammaproteobacteria bacterium]